MPEKALDLIGLFERGLLDQNYQTDIVVFDPLTVKDTTFEEPDRYPIGTHYVIGKDAIDRGRHSGGLAGRGL